MPYISFTFQNTNQIQDFYFNDEMSAARNPVAVGPINSGDTSPPLQCWAGDGTSGRVTIVGSGSGALAQDIKWDGYNFRY